MNIDSVGCCKMLVIVTASYCSTLINKSSSKMCRLSAAIIFINITMGMGMKMGIGAKRVGMR